MGVPGAVVNLGLALYRVVSIPVPGVLVSKV